jgi:predicted nucleotidyltransferase
VTDGNLDELSRRVSHWAKSHPEIRRVVLFGSRARGDHTPESDVDLAVLVSSYRGEDPFTRFHFECASWKAELVATLGQPVSLVEISNEARPEIQNAIERDGVLLYNAIAA